jgi:hypothetical protein
VLHQWPAVTLLLLGEFVLLLFALTVIGLSRGAPRAVRIVRALRSRRRRPRPRGASPH